MNGTDLRHANVICQLPGHYYQAYCACGWSSTISFYEEVDLLRAMHAHVVVSFPGFR